MFHVEALYLKRPTELWPNQLYLTPMQIHLRRYQLHQEPYLEPLLAERQH